MVNMDKELGHEPSLAVICSFFNKFGVMLGLRPLSFSKLESLLTSFDTGGKVDKELIELHAKLLRKVGLRGISDDKWMNGLLKFCSLDPYLEKEMLSLERFGYAHSPLSTKLNVLKSLCEKQFDYNPKFREAILTSLTGSDLRLLPVGIDSSGQAYWYQQDGDLNVRIYSEEPDDQSGGTWTPRVKNRDQLANLIAHLKEGRTSAEETSQPFQQPTTSAAAAAATPLADSQLYSTEDPASGEADTTAKADAANAAEQPQSSSNAEEEPAAPSGSVPEKQVAATDEPSSSSTTTDQTAESSQPVTSSGDVAEKEKPVEQSEADAATAESDSKPLPQAKETSESKDAEDVKAETTVKSEPADKEDTGSTTATAVADDSKSAEQADGPEAEDIKPQDVLDVKTKGGLCLDLHQTEAPKPKPKKSQTRKSELISEAKQEVAEDRSGEDSSTDIPDELKPFIERRIMPRRGAAKEAAQRLLANTIKREARPAKATPSPKKKAAENKTAAEVPEVAEQQATANGIDESSSQESSSGEEQDSTADSNISGEEEEPTSDDDFIPLAELKRRSKRVIRKSGGKRRRRHAAESDVESDFDEDDDSTPLAKPKKRKQATEETLCGKCAKSTNPEVLLLCDKCDAAWHTFCLTPPLWYVPDDDWFCPACQHNQLCDKLAAALQALDDALAKRQLDNRKKQAADRLARERAYIDISLNNIIADAPRARGKEGEDEDEDDGSEEEEEQSDDSQQRRARRHKAHKKQHRDRRPEPVVPIAVGRSRRRTKQVDYNFSNYDEIIKESIEEIEDAPNKGDSQTTSTGVFRPSGGAGRGKDMANILQAAEKARSSAERKDSTDTGSQTGEDSAAAGGDAAAGERTTVARPPLNALKSKKKKLTDLDVDNQTESEASEYEDENKNGENKENRELDGRGSSASFQPTDVSESEESDQSWMSDDDEPKRRSRRVQQQRRKADRDFVVSESDSDYQPEKPQRRRRKPSGSSEDSLIEEARGTKKSAKKRGRYQSDSDSESDYGRSKRKPKRSSGGGSAAKRHSSGGRSNRSKVNYRKIAGAGSDSEDEYFPSKRAKASARPVGARGRVKIESDSGKSESGNEWVPEEQDDEEENAEASGAEADKPAKLAISDSEESADDSSQSASAEAEPPVDKAARKTGSAPTAKPKPQSSSDGDNDKNDEGQADTKQNQPSNSNSKSSATPSPAVAEKTGNGSDATTAHSVGDLLSTSSGSSSTVQPPAQQQQQQPVKPSFTAKVVTQPLVNVPVPVQAAAAAGSILAAQLRAPLPTQVPIVPGVAPQPTYAALSTAAVAYSGPGGGPPPYAYVAPSYVPVAAPSPLTLMQHMQPPSQPQPPQPQQDDSLSNALTNAMLGDHNDFN